MKYKVNKVIILNSGIIIDLIQKRKIGKILFIFNKYKIKRIVAFRSFKKGFIINPNISYTDWVIIDKRYKNKKDFSIKPENVVKNKRLIKLLNKVLLKTKSIKKWTQLDI